MAWLSPASWPGVRALTASRGQVKVFTLATPNYLGSQAPTYLLGSKEVSWPAPAPARRQGPSPEPPSGCHTCSRWKTSLTGPGRKSPNTKMPCGRQQAVCARWRALLVLLALAHTACHAQAEPHVTLEHGSILEAGGLLPFSSRNLHSAINDSSPRAASWRQAMGTC
jgi:hypothetical protein